AEVIDIGMRHHRPADGCRLETDAGEIRHKPLFGCLVDTHVEQQRPLAADKEVEAEHAAAERGVDAMNASRDLDRYSPLNSGSRFSTNARRRSAASSVVIRYEHMTFSEARPTSIEARCSTGTRFY